MVSRVGSESRSGKMRDTYQAYAIRCAMALANMTTADLHERLGSRPETIRRWLNGSAYPGPYALAKLASALRVPVSYISTGGGLAPAAPPVTRIRKPIQ
jgi:transcriptional regulator with XRE-family HTH domain